MSDNQHSLRPPEVHESVIEAHGCETKRNRARSVTPSSDILFVSSIKLVVIILSLIFAKN